MTKGQSDFWEKAQQYPDPTRCFSFLVIAIIVVNYLIAVDWDFTLVFWGFFANSYVVFFFTLACLTVYLAQRNQTQPLPVYDRWAAEWYWWNAWFYHMTLDGASGSFRLVPVVVNQYDMLDLRFINRHPIPWGVGVVELFLMGPLCLACVYAIHTRHVARYPLEFVTCAVQYMGLIIFMVSEVVLDGQVNVPALDPVGVPGNAWANLKFDLYHFTYYWFGFWFCNLVWAFVPLVRVKRAWDECRVALLAFEKQKIQ
jgi:hypothetical protein